MVESRLTNRYPKGTRKNSTELEPLAEQGKAKGFFNNVANADKLGGLVEGIRDAVMEYQVCNENGDRAELGSLITRVKIIVGISLTSSICEC